MILIYLYAAEAFTTEETQRWDQFYLRHQHSKSIHEHKSRIKQNFIRFTNEFPNLSPYDFSLQFLSKEPARLENAIPQIRKFLDSFSGYFSKESASQFEGSISQKILNAYYKDISHREKSLLIRLLASSSEEEINKMIAGVHLIIKDCPTNDIKNSEGCLFNIAAEVSKKLSPTELAHIIQCIQLFQKETLSQLNCKWVYKLLHMMIDISDSKRDQLISNLIILIENFPQIDGESHELKFAIQDLSAEELKIVISKTKRIMTIFPEVDLSLREFIQLKQIFYTGIEEGDRIFDNFAQIKDYLDQIPNITPTYRDVIFNLYETMQYNSSETIEFVMLAMKRFATIFPHINFIDLDCLGIISLAHLHTKNPNQAVEFFERALIQIQKDFPEAKRTQENKDYITQQWLTLLSAQY